MDSPTLVRSHVHQRHYKSVRLRPFSGGTEVLSIIFHCEWQFESQLLAIYMPIYTIYIVSIQVC